MIVHDCCGCFHSGRPFVSERSDPKMYNFPSAVVAELADAMALGAIGRKAVEVRVLSTAPTPATEWPITIGRRPESEPRC
jgi:hypothetical protein